MNIAFRVDASTQIGTGHVMRCLALAQAWKRLGRDVFFVMSEVSPVLRDRLVAEGMHVRKLSVLPGGVEDAAQTLAIIVREGAKTAVIDGYRFDAAYQRILKTAVPKLLCIDDYGHAGHYYADLILNQNLSASAQLYQDREAHSKLLLGTRYALLRREFWPWRGEKRRVNTRVGRVLVTLGGGDQHNVTHRVVQALRQLDGEVAEAVVVFGSDNPHGETLDKASETGTRGIHIRWERDVRDMSMLMASSDLAISAAGSTSWELAFMGVPALQVVLADNQRPIADALHTAGAAVNLGWHGDVTSDTIARDVQQLIMMPDERAKMGRCGQELVDGEGVEEVVAHLEGARLGLRRACERDTELLWKWANDSVTRELSFTTAVIPWNCHVKWMRSKLGDAGCAFFVATDDDGIPVGQARFDVDGDVATISISVDRDHRDKGYGSEIIRTGSHRLLRTMDLGEIRAYIKPGNEPSVRAFRRAGFVDAGTTEVGGRSALCMTMTRGDVL